jgi:hypothetical protein
MLLNFFFEIPLFDGRSARLIDCLPSVSANLTLPVRMALICAPPVQCEGGEDRISPSKSPKQLKCNRDLFSNLKVELQLQHLSLKTLNTNMNRIGTAAS